MIVGGMVVFVSLCIKVCRCMVSKALDMSSATAIVRCGGLRWLNPSVICLFIVCSAVVVE